ncbi:MAG: hypothetical protein AAF846_26540 [Chloroflexota bacterium]
MPRFLLVAPIAFALIGIWLIYQWGMSLNVRSHPLSKLLFESPQDLKKLVVTKNLGNHRITFVQQDGTSSFVTIWKNSYIEKMINLVQQHTPQDIEIEYKNNLQ